MGMESVVQCGFCEKPANRFFLTLDGSLWVTCDDHAHPFEGVTYELDPDKYNLDAYFEALIEYDEEEVFYEE